MNINNPTTFAAPNLTFTTANSSGTSGALRADDDVLLYDTTSPASVAPSPVVGSAATAARRDHVHSGVAAITSVDNSIARYSGTAGALQGYTSNAPLFTDAGVMALTSGQLGFPDTVNVSTDPNTQDAYEEGTFTPYLADNSGSASEEQTYNTRVGRFTRIGNICYVQIVLGVLSLGNLVTSEFTRIYGLPFPTEAATGNQQSLTVGYASSLVITAGYTVTAYMAEDVSRVYPSIFNTTGGVTRLLISELSAGGALSITGVYEVKD